MSEINEQPGVLVPVGLDEARRLDRLLKAAIDSYQNSWEKVVQRISECETAQIHVALGFPSWTAYAADTIRVTARLDRGQRRELVGLLSDKGLGQRPISEIVGVDQKTVSNDLRALRSGEEFSSPAEVEVGGMDSAETADCVEMAEVSGDAFDEVLTEARSEGDLSRENVVELCRASKAKPPAEPKTLGRDNKTYDRRKPKPRRGPLTDDARRLATEMRRMTDRINKLLADDRFGANREQIGRDTRYWAEQIAQAANQLHEATTTKETQP